MQSTGEETDDVILVNETSSPPKSKKSSVYKRLFALFAIFICVVVIICYLSRANQINKLQSKSRTSNPTNNQPVLDEQPIQQPSNNIIISPSTIVIDPEIEIIEDITPSPDNENENDDLGSIPVTPTPVIPAEDQRYDCDPLRTSTEETCIALGCKWEERARREFDETNGPPISEPWCYFPSDYIGYTITRHIDRGTFHRIELKRNVRPASERLLYKLWVDVAQYDNKRIMVTIQKAGQRESDNLWNGLTFASTASQDDSEFSVEVLDNWLQIRRKDNNVLIWSANIQTIMFENEFRQIDTQVPMQALYGLGERMDNFLKTDFNYNRYTFFNRDRTPAWKVHTYSSHPTYLMVEQDRRAHQVLFYNKYPSEAILRPGPSITWRSMGGDLVFYINTGDNPLEANSNYVSMSALPMLPPIWSLGYHIGKAGLPNMVEIEALHNRMIENELPYDVYWSDVDILDKRGELSYNANQFFTLPDFIERLRQGERRHVVTITPTTPVLDQSVCVRNPDNTPLRMKTEQAEVECLYDLLSNAGQDSYINSIKNLNYHLKYDGIGLINSEPSNSVDGSLDGCVNDNLDRPSYSFGDDLKPFYKTTICMSAIHDSDTPHYKVHNTYSLMHAQATNRVFNRLEKKPFVMSRSTTTLSGSYTGHFVPSPSTFEQMKKSITTILEFNLFGIPFVGEDICGTGTSNEELCARWHQLGAFYPFSRVFSSKNADHQDPGALGNLVIESARKSFHMKYQLNNYLYTLLYEASTYGLPVVRSLMMVFPKDESVSAIDTQFMWGNALMIIPVLEEGATHVTAYFPKSLWYDAFSFKQILNSNGVRVRMNAPTHTPYLAVRGGSILMMQDPGLTLEKTLQNAFHIVIFLDENQEAIGNSYWKNRNVVLRVSESSFTFTSSVEMRSDTEFYVSSIKVSIIGLQRSPRRLWGGYSRVAATWENKIYSFVTSPYMLSRIISWDY